jgi:4-hydroxythreonine-4-phosphate dehydrogenase
LKPKIAISIGDMNGVGPAIALLGHETISQWCEPIYCVSKAMIAQSAERLHRSLPESFRTYEVGETFDLAPGTVSAESGHYSYESFMAAIKLAEHDEAAAICTLPIHKEAWQRAGLPYVGHTDLLREYFHQPAIMMLGCEKLYIALFTEHIPLQQVPSALTQASLSEFLRHFQQSVHAKRIAVLGLNPHAGDHGVLGDEERVIEAAIAQVNQELGFACFEGPLVPDVAFTPRMRERYTYYVAMYHDQGLAPLKALFFEESINVSLHLPIIRTSVDHGTAFDIAYAKTPSLLSYYHAIQAAIALINQR